MKIIENDKNANPGLRVRLLIIGGRIMLARHLVRNTNRRENKS